MAEVDVERLRALGWQVEDEGDHWWLWRDDLEGGRFKAVVVKQLEAKSLQAFYDHLQAVVAERQIKSPPDTA